MEVVAGLSSFLVGTSAVPTAAGVMGPLAGSAGIIGAGGAVTAGGVLGALGTGLTLASAASSIFGGMEQGDAYIQNSNSEARALELLAREEEIEARAEEVRGIQESNDILDELTRTVAAQQVAASSKGVDIGFGTPVALNNEARRIGRLQMSVSRDDAVVRALARRRQASAYQEQRINTLRSGYRSAGNSVLSGATSALSTVGSQIERRLGRG